MWPDGRLFAGHVLRQPGDQRLLGHADAFIYRAGHADEFNQHEFDANDVANYYAYVTDPLSTATVSVAGGVGNNFYVAVAGGGYSYIADPVAGIYSELSGFDSSSGVAGETVTGTGGSTYAYVYSASNASFVGDPAGSKLTSGKSDVDL